MAILLLSKSYENHPPFSLKQLQKHLVCCPGCCCCCFMPRPDISDYVEQDNCCNFDLAAIKASLPFLEEVMKTIVEAGSTPTNSDLGSEWLLGPILGSFLDC